jgi:hypothetical protein
MPENNDYWAGSYWAGAYWGGGYWSSSAPSSLKIRIYKGELSKLGITHGSVVPLKLRSEDVNVTQRGEDV